MSKGKNRQRTLDLILNNLKCYLCLEEFKDPRLLNCHHSFCKECLDGYITTCCEDGVLECPLCESEMKVPEKGARALRRNYFYQLQEQSIGEFCQVCGEEEEAKKHCIECNQDFLCVMCEITCWNDSHARTSSAESRTECKQATDKTYSFLQNPP